MYLSHMGERVVLVTSLFACILLIIAFTGAPSPSAVWRGASGSFAKIDGNLSSKLHSTLADRLALADRLWRQAATDRQQMLAAYRSDTQFPDGYINPYNVFEYARPSFFCPHDLERVGRLNDGGKWVCGMSRYEIVSPGPSSEQNSARPIVIYSFGVNDDSSFEAAFLQRTNAEIWGYDFSVANWAGEIPESRLMRAHFRKAGIANETDEMHDPPFYSVQDLMRINGHEFIDVMKMDIEGSEFQAIESLVAFWEREKPGRPLPIGQLLIEIHIGGSLPASPQNIAGWVDWFSSMERLGLRPVNNEDNWIGDAGPGRPRCMEYTLINAVDTAFNVLLWE